MYSLTYYSWSFCYVQKMLCTEFYCEFKVVVYRPLCLFINVVCTGCFIGYYCYILFITMTVSHTTKYIHQCDNPLVSTYINVTIPGEVMHNLKYDAKSTQYVTIVTCRI